MNQNKLNALLERHYKTVETTILSRQDPVTGLLPASTAVNAHGDYTDAWVRDNVYSILCVWGLAMSYRRYQPNHHRAYLLSQSVVKLMRGLLISMMRQADRVEVFKKSLKPVHALHAKYGTQTGLAVVGDEEWGHLQLDATSLYLLMVAQMTASGLRLIYTQDEVNFVQNLVHYISRTYCTPDYGIWERGNKINKGKTEINCSSVGMAKAALEALEGFNLFGNVASQEAVIHVIPSDVARSRFTLKGLLPRESNSKETDAALLSIIGYPAYAVEDKKLVKRTRNKIIKKLGGNYGCKRFLLDGHQSVLEDPNRLYYEPSELRKFEHIESEWPLFYTYLLLDALMREDARDVRRWQKKLAPLFIEQNGSQLLPELYFVAEENVAAEKAEPGSQTRVANENLPLIWAQSLYMLSDMMLEGILRPNDIDPLRRRERIGHTRVSLPLVAVLGVNETVKQALLDRGIRCETLDQVKPLRIMQASELSRVHTLLGKNDKLHLSGRPYLVTRTISTAWLYLLAGEETLFLPYYFNPRGFYFSYDNTLLVEHFRASLKFLAIHWDHPGQPLIPLLVREDMLQGEGSDEVLALLNDIQQGECENVTLKNGPLAQLLTTAAVERIDYLHGQTFRDWDHDLELPSLLSESTRADGQVALTLPEEALPDDVSDALLVQALVNSPVTAIDRSLQTRALGLLWDRHGAAYKLSDGDDDGANLAGVAQQLYEIATIHHDWSLVRQLAERCRKSDDRLEDALLDIVIRQKRLAVGRAYSENAIFSKPLDSAAMVETIQRYCGNNVAENVLTQEIILHLGHLIRNEPRLFKNMLTLRTWYFVQLLVGDISRGEKLPMGDAYTYLLGLAPHAIYDRLRAVLKSLGVQQSRMAHQENLHASGIPQQSGISAATAPDAPEDVRDWALWRQNAGMISRLSPGFYKDVWHMLQRCKGIVIGDKFRSKSRIGHEMTFESTAGERSFALRIESLLQGIQAPDYRQLNIEVIESLAWLFKQSPDFRVDDDLVIDVLIGHAVRINWEKNHGAENYNEHRAKAWEAIYRLSPKAAEETFIAALMYLLVPQENAQPLAPAST